MSQDGMDNINPFDDPHLNADGPIVGKEVNLDQSRLFIFLLLLLTVGEAVTLVVILPSLRPPHNMLAQPYHRPDTPSELFADGMSERPLESGVVPRPADQSPGISYVAVRTPGPAQFPVVSQDQKIPIAVTPEVLNRGQELFNVFCSVCHGAAGEGNGMIVQRGFYPPPSFHIDRLRNVPDSHFFNVITNGYGTMFSYSDRVAPEDRWKIVAYIRALQAGVERNPELKQRFNKERGVVLP